MIAVATLISGTEVSIGDGRNKPFRAPVRIGEDRPISAICKRVSREQIAAECYAATLLKAWGLHVPTPLIVVDRDELLFGSTEEYPSLKQRLSISSDLPPDQFATVLRIACEIVASFEETPLAIVADEAIDNRDRNVGNILWDGSTPSFIDHEAAFGLSKDRDANKLVNMVINAGKTEAVSIKSVASSLTWTLPEIHDLSSHTDLDVSAFSAYVSARIATISARVLDRFPKPIDLLSEIT